MGRQNWQKQRQPADLGNGSPGRQSAHRMPRARGLLPCLWPYGLEPREGALGPGWVRWKQFTLRAIGSLVPVFRHSIGTSQRWWNRAGWAHAAVGLPGWGARAR